MNVRTEMFLGAFGKQREKLLLAKVVVTTFSGHSVDYGCTG